MNTAVEFTRWAFFLGLLCGALAAGTGCPQLSGDPLDKPLVPGSTYKIIASHGPDGADDFGTYHASRGSVETIL